ncbi:MAG: hypothetical protein JSS02_19340 [Planctomycetes bacterium]|nr:hypothetical protein [Planctomycetota bacterium]
MTTSIQKEFSADLALRLVIGDREMPLTKIGPSYAVLRDEEEIPAGTRGIIFLVVDGREHRWDVILRHGTVPFDRKFFFDTTKGPARTLFNPFLS